MKILVTGASGWIGRALVAHLLTKGHSVRAAVRRAGSSQASPSLLPPSQMTPIQPSTSSDWPVYEEVEVGDIHQTTRWQHVLKGCDVIIHTAARVHQMNPPKTKEEALVEQEAYNQVNTVGTLTLVKQAAEEGVKRFIFLSSVKSMGERGFFRAEDPCHPKGAYSYSKRRAEEGLQALGNALDLDWVILRLPLVYGPGVGGNFLRLMTAIQQKRCLPFGLIRNARSLMGLGNLVDLIEQCTHDPRASRGIFLPSDGQPISTPALIRALAKELNQPVRLWPVPVICLRLGALLWGQYPAASRLLDSLVVDSTPLQHQLHWKPPRTMQQELAETVAQFLHSPR
jgi:nucleoside-diphosphate-sugar epimerase